LAVKLFVAAAAISQLASATGAPVASAETAPGPGQAPLARSAAAALSTSVTQKVIVVPKDQVPQAPASTGWVGTRHQVEAEEQAPIAGELSQTMAKGVHSYTTINALSDTVSPGKEARLAANPAVAEVVPDQIIHLSSALGPSASRGSSAGPHPRCRRTVRRRRRDPRIGAYHYERHHPSVRLSHLFRYRGSVADRPGWPVRHKPDRRCAGESATIPVTIAPSAATGAVGSRISGVLYLDDDSLYSLFGGLGIDANTVAAIPYSYTIGG
jgi:hypothetical protein